MRYQLDRAIRIHRTPFMEKGMESYARKRDRARVITASISPTIGKDVVGRYLLRMDIEGLTISEKDKTLLHFTYGALADCYLNRSTLSFPDPAAPHGYEGISYRELHFTAAGQPYTFYIKEGAASEEFYDYQLARWMGGDFRFQEATGQSYEKLDKKAGIGVFRYYYKFIPYT